jgi:hypothetical protein
MCKLKCRYLPSYTAVIAMSVEVTQNCVTANFVTRIIAPLIIFIEKYVIKATLMPLSLAIVFGLGKYNQSLL